MLVAGAQCHEQSSPPGGLPFQLLPILPLGNYGAGFFLGIIWWRLSPGGGKLGRWFGRGGLGLELKLFNLYRFVREMDGIREIQLARNEENKVIKYRCHGNAY